MTTEIEPGYWSIALPLDARLASVMAIIAGLAFGLGYLYGVKEWPSFRFHVVVAWVLLAVAVVTFLSAAVAFAHALFSHGSWWVPFAVFAVALLTIVFAVFFRYPDGPPKT